MKTVTEPMLLAALKAAHLLDTPASRRDMTNAIETALKEREAPPKAQPMSERDIDRLALDSDHCIYGELMAFRHGFRAAERHHRITGD